MRLLTIIICFCCVNTVFGQYYMFGGYNFAAIDMKGSNAIVSSFNTTAYGGGIYAKNSTLIIMNSKISDNEASTFSGYSSYGGGIYVDSSILTITNSEISTNNISVSSPTAPNLYATFGAGIASVNSVVTITGCLIDENFAFNSSSSIPASTL